MYDKNTVIVNINKYIGTTDYHIDNIWSAIAWKSKREFILVHIIEQKFWFVVHYTWSLSKDRDTIVEVIKIR